MNIAKVDLYNKKQTLKTAKSEFEILENARGISFSNYSS